MPGVCEDSGGRQVKEGAYHDRFIATIESGTD